ncbi:hypothetical protein V6N12_031995 [Hibiscus sabdariffa]|uniref:Uncharacterized protein n=1 Tax=Hibiscus sabdariffa TaxID=183260 RepID=A0ABR2C0I8_9ROSI
MRRMSSSDRQESEKTKSLRLFQSCQTSEGKRRDQLEKELTQDIDDRFVGVATKRTSGVICKVPANPNLVSHDAIVENKPKE